VTGAAARWTPRRVARVARRVVLLGSLAGALYLGLRFKVRSLSEEACCPLLALQPGERVLVDVDPRPLAPGDVVFLGIEGGGRTVARVERVRPEDAALWVSTDREGCPGAASEGLGWIPRGAVVGRVLFGLGGGG